MEDQVSLDTIMEGAGSQVHVHVGWAEGAADSHWQSCDMMTYPLSWAGPEKYFCFLGARVDILTSFLVIFQLKLSILGFLHQILTVFLWKGTDLHGKRIHSWEQRSRASYTFQALFLSKSSYRHGKSEKSSASRFAFSNFHKGEIPNLGLFYGIFRSQRL